MSIRWKQIHYLPLEIVDEENYEKRREYVKRKKYFYQSFVYISQKYVWYIAKKMKCDIINVEYMWIGKRRTYE